MAMGAQTDCVLLAYVLWVVAPAAQPSTLTASPLRSTTVDSATAPATLPIFICVNIPGPGSGYCVASSILVAPLLPHFPVTTGFVDF